MANIIGNITKHAFCRFTALLSVLPLLLLSQSCVEERPKVLENTVLSLEPLRLELSAAKVDFSTPADSRQTVQVRSANMDWMFTDIPEWITVTPASGSGDTEVSIEVSENTDVVTRVGFLRFGSTFGSWNYSMEFTVSQYRIPYSISLPVDEIIIDGGSISRSVQVESNTDTWTIIIPESMDWCTARKTEDGMMVITTSENKSNKSRSGVIELHTDDVSAYLTVTQRPSGITNITESVDFPVTGGIKALTVNVEGSSWSIENNYSWIDVKTNTGSAGLVSIPIEAVPNYSSMARNGFIYIVISDENKIEIPVHQDGMEYSVDRDVISVSSSGSTERLIVQSNLPWRIVAERIPDWITVNPVSAESGGTTVLVNVRPNRFTSLRSASLPIDIVSPQDGSVTLGQMTVDIEQDGRMFGADSSAIHFSDKAGSTWFNIKSNDYWFVTSTYSWITLDPDEGEESGQVKVSVTENSDSTTRIGTIVVRTSGQRDTIPVYQAGRYIRLSSDALTFGSRGDSTAVSLATNGHWTATADKGWITLSATEGDGNCQLLITAQDNASSSSREGEVTVTRDNMNPVIITVNQKGRYLNVSTSLIEFFPEGGTSEPVIVQTDGSYGITTSADWITINKETESQFTVTVSENTNTGYRTGDVTILLIDLLSDTLIHNITVSQRGQPVYEYVDLGLSVYWATFNVGASAPEECGDYFAWCETEPYYEPGYAQSESPVWKSGKEGGYAWSSYSYCMGDSTSIIKYNLDDKLTTLEMYDDVANRIWGGDWRMPSMDEFKELQQYCSWELITLNGMKGFKVTSKRVGFEDQSIFLPSCGARGYNMFAGYGEESAIYWSNTLHKDSLMFAYAGLCDTSSTPEVFRYSRGPRIAGLPVRPVCPSTTYTPEVSQVLVDCKFIDSRLDMLWGIDWDTEWQYDWDESSVEYGTLGYTKPELIKGTIYNVDNTGNRFSSYYKIFDPDGGYISLTTGSTYDILFYNFGTEWTSFYQSDDYETYTASTRTSSMSSFVNGDIEEGSGDSPDNTVTYVDYNQPDELFGTMVTGVELGNDPSAYEISHDEDGNTICYYNIDKTLYPYSFIYLYQIVILNNADEKGNRVTGAKGLTVTGLAQGVDLFTRKTFSNTVSVSTEDIKPMQNHNNVRMTDGSIVDNAGILAARVLTWGLPGINPLGSTKGSPVSTVIDNNYIGIGLTLRNGYTYTITRDITEQMHEKPTGGVITVYIDANDIPDDILEQGPPEPNYGW